MGSHSAEVICLKKRPKNSVILLIMSKNDNEAKKSSRVEGREQVGGNFGSSASRHGNSPVSSIGKSMRSAPNFPRKSSSRSCRKFAGLRPRSDQTSRKARGGIPMPISGTSWKSRMVRSFNPISPLITTARECLTAQPLTLLPAFWIVTTCAAIATFLGLVLYRLAMPHLIVRMGG